MNIYLNLSADNAEELCRICNEFECDINVIYGSICVDGKSLVGVMKMCNHIVQLSPVTSDEFLVEKFYREVVPIGGMIGE